MPVGSYPASISQRLLWLAARRSGAGAAATPRQYLIKDLNAGALQLALTDLRFRHEALRTRLTGSGPNLTQMVDEPSPLPVEWADGNREPEAAATPADTPAESRPEVICRLLRREEGSVLLLDIDHLLTDAWSYRVIGREIAQMYAARQAGQVPELPDVGWQYRQFAEWQIDHLRGEALERLQESWLKRLVGAQGAALPVPERRLRRLDRVAGISRFRLDEETATALSALTVAGRTTGSAAALAIFFLQLALITGQDDISIGSIFANRTIRQTRGTVGLFANVLPLRITLDSSATVRDLLGRAHQTTAHALANQELPMQLLPTGALQKETAASINGIIFHVLPPSDAGAVGRGSGEALAVRPAPLSAGSGARFDFELSLALKAGSVSGSIRYATDRFSADWVAGFRRSFCDLIQKASADPDRRISELRVLPDWPDWRATSNSPEMERS